MSMTLYQRVGLELCIKSARKLLAADGVTRYVTTTFYGYNISTVKPPFPQAYISIGADGAREHGPLDETKGP